MTTNGSSTRTADVIKARSDTDLFTILAQIADNVDSGSITLAALVRCELIERGYLYDPETQTFMTFDE